MSTSFHPSPLIELPFDMWAQVFQFLSVLDLLRIVRRVKCMKLHLSTFGSFSAKKWPCTNWGCPNRKYCTATSNFFVHIVLATSEKERHVLLHSSGWSTRHHKTIKTFLEPTYSTYKHQEVRIRKSGGNSDAMFVWIDGITNTPTKKGQSDVVWRSDYVTRRI